jgi:hypothetical protein
MNYTSFFTDIAGYMLMTFQPMQPYFWILFFGGIIGFIYCALNNLTAAVIAIILVFAIFATTSLSGYFAAVPLFNQFLYIIVLIGLTLLIGTFIMKRRV